MSERIIGPLPFWEYFENKLIDFKFSPEWAKNETENFKVLACSNPFSDPELVVKVQLVEMLDRIEAQRSQ